MRAAVLCFVVLLVAVGCLVPALPGPARAFERQTDEVTGVRVFWSTRRVIVRPAAGTSAELTDEQFMRVVLTSTNTWNTSAGCTDMRLEVGAPATGLETNAQGDPSDGENRIVWHESSWISNDASVLALTTIRYDRDSGIINDADIDVNGVNFFWSSVDEPLETDTDAENMLTHELGHLLGFAHSPVNDATMFASSLPGETVKRDLADDDALAMCSVYPTGLPSPSNGPLRGGLEGQFTCASMTNRAGAPLGGLIGVLVAIAWRRSRRARHAP